jgi:hypothetical protein
MTLKDRTTDVMDAVIALQVVFMTIPFCKLTVD